MSFSLTTMNARPPITTQGASLSYGSPSRQLCSWLPFNSLSNKVTGPQMPPSDNQRTPNVTRRCNIATQMPLLVCKACSYTSKRRSNLARHYKAMHSPNKHLRCCGLIFTSKSEMKQHVRDHHEQGYSCVKCRRVFRRKALLKRHISVHSGVKAFHCKVCPYASSHKSNLQRHQRVHDKDKWELNYGQKHVRGVAQPSCKVNSSIQNLENTMKQLTSIYHTLEQSPSAAKAQKSKKSIASPGVIRNNSKRLFAVPYKCLTCKTRLQSQRALKKHEKVVHPEAEVRALFSLPLKQMIGLM